jgi:exodeoxyribonuclease V gamma subunit
MLRITFANRFETLRDTLVDGLAAAPASPFVAEQVIVPSSALRRDLTLAIAERYGICANVEFSFLAQWLWRQIGKVVPAVSAESPFASPVLAWRIFQLFDDPAFVASHTRLASYLGQADAVIRFDLASKVAALFEQYMTYRPAWLAVWSVGQSIEIEPATDTVQADQIWQAALWRAITTQLGVAREHPATAFLRTVESIGAAAAQRFGLPETAHVFCLPTIPPLYLDILRQLGRWIDLRLYVLNPCREYWFEIVDRRRLSYLAARGEADYHETGNRLLAAWGKQTQAQIDLLVESAGEAEIDDGGFTEATSASMLARVQNAILNLVEIEPGSITPEVGDRSIEVHVCHSLTRELEVLQDQLLALFAGSNPPRPCDILVVTPDLEAAAPLVDAVFGNAPRERYIPYAISGRARSTLNAPARAVLALLALVGSRWQASAVFDLLQQPIIARRFGIAADDLEVIQGWLQVSGIRWGINAQHREQQGLPGLDRFSFDDGLQRLFLGYALPNGITRPWHERIPAGNAEGSSALLLGRFARFVADLTRLSADFSQAQSPDAWMRELFGVLDVFLVPDDAEIDDLGEVRDAIRELRDNMMHGGITTPAPLEVVRTALAALLDDPARGGVPTGMVTFSSISSLRNLPFRIVCAIGLNDGAFPSTSRPLEFDLMALAPQRGDRQRRNDERNLFLDLVLAARERLYLSYTGSSIRDNAPLPGSVLVAELIETLLPAIAADAFPASRDEARHRIVVKHPLQPFSPSYFGVATDPRARSFNRELCAAQRQALRQGLAVAPELTAISPFEADETDEADEGDSAGRDLVGRFFAAPLPVPGVEWREVSLERLIHFFRNPCKFLLRERLGIELAKAGDELADDEPFLVDFIGRQALAERLLPFYLDGMADTDLQRLALAGIEYPPGAFGDVLLEQELQHLREFAERVSEATTEACLPPQHASLEFDLDGETWCLSGAFADLRASGLVRHRYDDTRPTDYLAGWLSHLFLCAAAPEGVAQATCWLSRDGDYQLRYCAEANDILLNLLHLYRRGLRQPIHFFPKSAWAYISNNDSLSKAASTWNSSRGRPWGEAEDVAYRLALRGTDAPLDGDFMACAAVVFGSLLDFLEDARL